MQQPIIEVMNPSDVVHLWGLYESNKHLDVISLNELFYNTEMRSFYHVTDSGVYSLYNDEWTICSKYMSNIAAWNSSANMSIIKDMYERVKNYKVVKFTDFTGALFSFYVDMNLYDGVPEDELLNMIIIDNINTVSKHAKIVDLGNMDDEHKF